MGRVAVLHASPRIGAVGIVVSCSVAALLAVPNNPPRCIVKGRSVSLGDSPLLQATSRVIVVGGVADSLRSSIVSALGIEIMTVLSRSHLLI